MWFGEVIVGSSRYSGENHEGGCGLDSWQWKWIKEVKLVGFEGFVWWLYSDLTTANQTHWWLGLDVK